MKKLLLLALFPVTVSAAGLMICNGEYALCPRPVLRLPARQLPLKAKCLPRAWQSVLF